MRRFDVAVFGASISGSATAMHLASNGWSVLPLQRGKDVERYESLSAQTYAQLAVSRGAVFIDLARDPAVHRSGQLWTVQWISGGSFEEARCRHLIDAAGRRAFLASALLPDLADTDRVACQSLPRWRASRQYNARASGQIAGVKSWACQAPGAHFVRTPDRAGQALDPALGTPVAW